MLSPLTLPQKNMYETEKFYDKTSMCNVGGCVFLKEEVDINLLEKAINKVIEKSDGIRLRIHDNGIDVNQEFYEYEYEKFVYEKLNPNTYKIVLESWMQELFEISEKLYSFRIVSVGKKYGVFIKMHHLIADAWGTTLVASKIVEYYDKLKDGVDIPYDDICSYTKFIDSDKKYLSSTRYKRDEEFWQAKYEKKPSFVSMSPDKKTDLDVRAGRSSFVVPVYETEAIKKYCEENNISIAILLEALITVYASRINNADDITLCSLVLNRTNVEEKNTVGMFNNILPLTIDIDYNETFLDLCKKISHEHYLMFRHQKYPLSNIMKFIHEKHGTDTQLYDIIVSYQNAKLTTEAETEWVFNGTSDLGFMMNISDRDDNGLLNIDFDYRLNCFSADEIEKIYYRLINIVNQVVIRQDVRLKDIEIVTLFEKEQILVDFNDTVKKYSKTKCLHDFLEERAKKTPNKVALRFNDEEMTYKEFNEKVNRLANYITTRVNDRNSRIGLMMERSFDMLIGIYAIIKSGNCYMPIDPHFPADRIAFMIEDSNAPIILTNSKFNSVIQNKNLIVNCDEFNYDEYSDKNPDATVVSTDTAYVIYTSGSTGKPKGAAIAHHSVINRIEWMHEKYPLKGDDVILQKTPFTFDVSVWELFWWSMFGGTLHILVPEGHKDPFEIVEAIQNGKVTHMHFVPSMLNAFLEYVDANPDKISKLNSLKYVFSSGEALQAEQVRKFYKLFKDIDVTLHNLYGPTECTVDVSYYDCDKNNIPENIPIGKPVNNTQLLILDKNRKLLPVGVTGELYISGDLVGKGYVNRDELTEEKFVPNIYYNYAKMYKTGDLARWREDGNIEYLGRIDFQIKIRGLRVELGDIENAILKYKGVKQVVVLVFEINNEKNLCAYYTSDCDIDEKDLRSSISKELPDYMVPGYYMRLESIPVNTNGKADRKSFPYPNIKKETEKIVLPKNDVEEKILNIVKKVLKTNELSTEADLFSVGLTSIGVITIITELSKIGYELRVRDFYECHTVVEIANFGKKLAADTTDYVDDIKNYSNVADIKNHLLPKKEGNSILITGATSFLGIHIIRELIKTTDKKIYCMIRNKNKFEKFIEEFTELTPSNPRLIPVNGDITKANLGFDDNVINEIKENVSDIIHCAANVSFFCKWEESKNTNYVGTCNVLKLAKDSKAKLHHISTMSVSGDILVGQTKEYPEFNEDKLYIGQLYKDNVYVHSKYLAEKEVIKAIRNNEVNASIYRVANLTWRVSDGKFQQNYKVNDLYILTQVMLKYNSIPVELLNENLSMAPADECATVVCKLLDIEENRIYNIYSKNSLDMSGYLYPLMHPKVITLKEFGDLLKLDSNNLENQFVSMYISSIIDFPEKTIVSFENSKTNNFLESIGFNWSKLDAKYAKYVKNFEEGSK